MKTIYKSIALEAALLSVTLALQAEIQSEGETVTADVQASSLDRLKVTLVSPNVSGARDLVASGNATIDGNEIAVSLENLAFGTHRLVVSARFGTQVRTLYALDISVPQRELPNETQEYEDAAIVVSTYGDGGGGEFPTDYAKQGDDPTATLTDAQAYAQAAAEDAAAAKTAAQSLTSLDSDINAGKSAIALAVSSKGVPTSSADTMLQMATNIMQIPQAPISINGGEMYAKQLFGALTTPNYWNLYEILAMLLSDGRLANYGGILLAEYYKGYDSLALSGAGAGGAYVVSDMENGVFKMYTEDTTHVWDTNFDGKGNRWVAYCFVDEYHNFQITDTNTCPRSIFIGRKVGTITSLVNGRISEIVVTDGNELVDFISDGFEQRWSQKIHLRNFKNFSGKIFKKNIVRDELYIKSDLISGSILEGSSSNGLSFDSIIIDCPQITAPINKGTYYVSVKSIIFKNVETRINLSPSGTSLSPANYTSLIALVDCDASVLFYDPYGVDYLASDCIIYVSYKTQDKTRYFSLLNGVYQNAFKNVPIVSIMDGWNKNLNISPCVGLTESSMYAHILQRLKQDEPDCGDGVTITLGQTNLDKLTSQESIDLLDTLTNTYGYTFA